MRADENRTAAPNKRPMGGHGPMGGGRRMMHGGEKAKT